MARAGTVVILAAGQGTRMKSSTPKVLHRLCGRTMLGWALAGARELDPERLIVVVGNDDNLESRVRRDGEWNVGVLDDAEHGGAINTITHSRVPRSS